MNPTDNQTPQPVDELDEILETLAAIGRGWIIDQLDGTSFVKGSLDNIEARKAEAKARLLQWGTRQQISELEALLEWKDQELDADYRATSPAYHVIASSYVRSAIELRIRELQASLKDGGTK